VPKSWDESALFRFAVQTRKMVAKAQPEPTCRLPQSCDAGCTAKEPRLSV
jgi:hypothetical protein